MWPITHMVAPKSQALRCSQCHTSGGRLEQVFAALAVDQDVERIGDELAAVATT